MAIDEKGRMGQGVYGNTKVSDIGRHHCSVVASVSEDDDREERNLLEEEGRNEVELEENEIISRIRELTKMGT